MFPGTAYAFDRLRLPLGFPGCAPGRGMPLPYQGFRTLSNDGPGGCWLNNTLFSQHHPALLFTIYS